MTGRIYQGKGQQRSEPAPPWSGNLRQFDPQFYEPSEPLLDAVHVALTLGQPLLLTGEAGCGKTQLAHSLAWELKVPLLTFQTRSTSTHQDLLYRYDMLRHFQDVQLQRARADLETYIEYGELGQAIRMAERGERCVLLIDEIDKAPRDLPNDILNEVERMQFRVKETGREFKADPLHRPIPILTSNIERDIPDAFLRRCVFHHVGFPNRDQLRSIVAKRVPGVQGWTGESLDAAIGRFLAIRELGLEKKPSIAELLGWVDLLGRMGIDPGKSANDLGAEGRAALACSYSALAKSEKDLMAAKEHSGR